MEQLESSYLVAASKQKCDFTMDLSNSAISLEDAEEANSTVIDDFVDTKILYFHYYEERQQLFVVSKCGNLALYNVTTNDEDELDVQR